MLVMPYKFRKKKLITSKYFYAPKYICNLNNFTIKTKPLSVTMVYGGVKIVLSIVNYNYFVNFMARYALYFF